MRKGSEKLENIICYLIFPVLDFVMLLFKGGCELRHYLGIGAIVSGRDPVNQNSLSREN
jgi:hypothetical protein